MIIVGVFWDALEARFGSNHQLSHDARSRDDDIMTYSTTQRVAPCARGCRDTTVSSRSKQPMREGLGTPRPNTGKRYFSIVVREYDKPHPEDW